MFVIICADSIQVGSQSIVVSRRVVQETSVDRMDPIAGIYCGVLRHIPAITQQWTKRCFLRAEPCRDESRIASHLLASPRLLPGNSYKHLDDARMGKDHVTASAVTSCVPTVTQQLKHRWKERVPRVRSKVYRRDWNPFTSSSRWEIVALVLGSRQPRKVRSEDEELTCD
jgi:hypothetical protein